MSILKWGIVCKYIREGMGVRQKTLRVGSRVMTPFGVGTVSGGGLNVDLDHNLSGLKVGAPRSRGRTSVPRCGITANIDNVEVI